MRKKIHLTIDKSLLKKIEYISNELYISKGIIIDLLIEYAIRKQMKPLPADVTRKKITTTVNPDTWRRFKKYCDLNNYKYNYVIEITLSKQYRNFIRKIRTMNANDTKDVL